MHRIPPGVVSASNPQFLRNMRDPTAFPWVGCRGAAGEQTSYSPPTEAIRLARIRRGRAWSHRIPLAELKGVSPKRRKEMAARLGGEPGGARQLESPRHGNRRSLFRFGA